ncbi:ZIP zinc transporter-domain-containing protein [Mycena olivaceomarginata]|nr:ZIP zinc transporter-domain-containing protein [Mycena olivaceomarginata]
MPQSRKPAKPKSTRKPKAHPPRKITLKKPATIQAARYGVPEVVITRIANGIHRGRPERIPEVAHLADQTRDHVSSADEGSDGSDAEEEEGYREQADEEVVGIKKEKTQGPQCTSALTFTYSLTQPGVLTRIPSFTAPKPKSPVKHRRATDSDDSDSDSDVCIVVEVKRLKKVEKEASSEKKMTKARNTHCVNTDPDAEALQRRNSHHPTVVPPKVFYAGTLPANNLETRPSLEFARHYTGSHAAHGPERTIAPPKVGSDIGEQENDHQHDHGHGEPSHLDGSASAQIVGIAILEFGVLLHSVLIGLTLAVDEGFNVLFVVIVFHQTFEGLDLGSRLAFIKLLACYNYVPVLAAIIYGLSTPVDIAVGLALRSSYNPGSATASIVSGVLDSLSAGILLIYTD